MLSSELIPTFYLGLEVIPLPPPPHSGPDSGTGAAEVEVHTRQRVSHHQSAAGDHIWGGQWGS